MDTHIKGSGQRPEKKKNFKPWRPELGAVVNKAGCTRFKVWSPRAKKVQVCLDPWGRRETIPMQREEKGYFILESDAPPGALYYYVLDGGAERPDPASRHQPHGVHAPSRVVDTTAFSWSDAGWEGRPLEELIIYELHAGSFTPEGTFQGIINRLPYLARELGITALELMPVAQFPGERNWGYDGTYLFAPHHAYGGPEGLAALVDACHGQGLAVILDVVYNHLGPEGNYLWDFGPYFTDRYRTPWGAAVNFDGPGSDEVRRFFIENALYWVTEYHIDGLRLDAIHGIFDFSPIHILREIGEAVHRQGLALGRRIHVIAESDLNDVRVIQAVSRGGWGLDAQWSDDFHHSFHTLITGEKAGYYQDFGSLEHMAMVYEDGFTYRGQYSKYRERRHGTSARTRPGWQFVVHSQTHDQVGNRARGERLSALVPPEALKLAAGLVLTAPFVPLLFMGEEYAEKVPFLYFTSFEDQKLAQAIREGRKREFEKFHWKEEIPDPQDPNTFFRSHIELSLRNKPGHKGIFEYYKRLIRLRRSHPALTGCDRSLMRLFRCNSEPVLILERRDREGKRCCLILASFSPKKVFIRPQGPEGLWQMLLSSYQAEFESSPCGPQEFSIGSGSGALSLPPYFFGIYEKVFETEAHGHSGP
jgi:maltooligosyltrehalose trehalohydrolase